MATLLQARISMGGPCDTCLPEAIPRPGELILAMNLNRPFFSRAIRVVCAKKAGEAAGSKREGARDKWRARGVSKLGDYELGNWEIER
ncbi:MAG: hypothetical protein JRJ29_09070 [Deltaproteobacteria bacterium]|nr:hypothetical protein [Deltaproteobacteria bacterium]